MGGSTFRRTLLASLVAFHALGACGGEVDRDHTGVTGGSAGFVASSGGIEAAGGIGGEQSGGRGGSPSGGLPTGGETSGGESSGGGAMGGSLSGGAPSGGQSSGGFSPTGGAPSGGASTGGVTTGGAATGGTSTGGVPPSFCSTVATLPDMGTTCTTVGESRCDPNGNRCLCVRGVWLCDTSCAAEYPNPPSPNSACLRGQACDYPSGASCACVNLKWVCVGTGGCPGTLPATGTACDTLTGLVCDYPNSNSALHMACFCTGDTTGSTWTCIQSAACPATQPPYDLGGSCSGAAFCTYGTTHCSCLYSGTPWFCGLVTILSLLGAGDPGEPGAPSN